MSSTERRSPKFSRPAAQNAVVEVARAGVAAAARVVLVGEVGRGGREEARARPLTVAFLAVAADAAVEEDFLAAEQIRLRDRQRVSREPVAAVDLGQIRCLLELALGRLQPVFVWLEGWLVGALEAGVRLGKALVHEDDVLRVQLAGVAEKAGLAASRLHERRQLLHFAVGEE